MKRRYKLFLIIFISFILIIIIYFLFLKKDKLYLSIGYSLNGNFNTYTYIDYLKKDVNYYNFDNFNTIDELNEKIKSNYGNINYYINKAYYITLCLDSYELNNYELLDDNIINDYLNNIELLFKVLSKNRNVFFINSLNEDYIYINEKIKDIASSYKIYYIDYNFFKSELYYVQNSAYLSQKGHKKLSNLIKSRISLLPR